jgi:alkanesulfonate monooxygenase SsuD/methylene tetrahydromethanopterin reductase-like flavin-dependent oxidoreductase (luciferase family)
MSGFGVHTGLQNTTAAELRSLWRRAEEAGFDSISVWDHIYSSDLSTYACHEAVAMHTALATVTNRVRCGCLVYCAGFRHPGILAKAVATIDELSDGRAEVGLGAGWAEPEYQAFGIPFPPLGERFDLLDEATAAVRMLLHQGKADLAGNHLRLHDARLDPRPVQRRLPIWIGGVGERRTAGIAARHADGWNVPFVAPDVLRRKRTVLDDHCAAIGRDPAEVRLGVNVVVCDSDASLAAQFGPRTDAVRPGAVVGTSVDALADALGRYLEAGADQVNVALRAPWDDGALDRAAAAVATVRQP